MGVSERVLSLRQKFRVFANFILKNSQSLFHVKFFQPTDARRQLILTYMINDEYKSVLAMSRRVLSDFRASRTPQGSDHMGVSHSQTFTDLVATLRIINR